jgi:hypothetical protein
VPALTKLRWTQGLRCYVFQAAEVSRFRGHTDVKPRFARRLGWYALVRLMWPRVLVGTGVDKGLGSVLQCRALLRNRAEGRSGCNLGTDINLQADWLLSGRYAATGKTMCCDSIASLQALEETVDVLINDSDHSAGYEAREYKVIATKLGNDAVILSDNAHVSDALERFSRARGRSFLCFHEQQMDHWCRGAGIGFSFSVPAPRSSTI